jgi:hypothetical protein
VDSVFAAEAAILVHLELIRGVLLVFLGVVVALFAFVTAENNLYAHFGTSIYFASLLWIGRNSAVLRHNLFLDTQNKPICRQVKRV